MTREEVLRDAPISYETLRRWVNAGLVPTPERGNQGRAGGKWSEYPPETVWEIAAAAHLLKSHSIKQVAEIREAGRGLIAEECCGSVEEINSKFEKWQKANTDIYEEEEHGVIYRRGEIVPETSESPYYENDLNVDTMAFSWFMARYKSEYGVSLDAAARVQIEYIASLEIEPGAENYDDDTKTVKQSWNGAEHTVLVDWRVTKVESHAGVLEDIIVLHDAETGIWFNLKPFKRRKS